MITIGAGRNRVTYGRDLSTVDIKVMANWKRLCDKQPGAGVICEWRHIGEHATVEGCGKWAPAAGGFSDECGIYVAAANEMYWRK